MLGFNPLARRALTQQRAIDTLILAVGGLALGLLSSRPSSKEAPAE